ncbi:MAG: hypothetical protein ACT4P6_09935 [Gemmatimonadaceae bacterium]
MSWLLPAAARRRILTTAALTGAWGVVTGFALFVLLSPEVGQFGSRAGLVRLALIVAVAVAAASFVERLRDLIHEPNEHRGKRALGPAVFSVLLLAVFELCVMAYEHATERTLQSRYVLQEIAQRVTESSAVTEGYPLLWPEDIREPDSVLARLTAASRTEEPNPARRFADLLREPDRRVLSRCHAHAAKYLCGDERQRMSIDSYGEVLLLTVTDSTARAADFTPANPLFEPQGGRRALASLIAPNDPAPRRQFPERGVQTPVASRRSLFEDALADTTNAVDTAQARASAQPNDTGQVRNAYDVLLERLNAVQTDSMRPRTWRDNIELYLTRLGDRIQWQSGVRPIGPAPDRWQNPFGLYEPAFAPPPSAILASDLSDALNHVLLRRDVYRSEYFDTLTLDSGRRTRRR